MLAAEKIERLNFENEAEELKFLLSNAFRRKVEKFLHAITGNYKLKLVFKSGMVCTDNKTVWVDPTSRMLKGLPLMQKILGIEGQTGHEGFHGIYTDFKTLNQLEKMYRKGFHYMVHKDYLNITEDSAIELAGCSDFPGVAPSIRFINELAFHHLPSLPQAEKEGKRLKAHQTACAQYAIIGRVNGHFEHDKELQDIFKRSIPFLDKGRVASDSWGRLECSERICELAKPLMDEAREKGQMEPFHHPKGNDMMEEVKGEGKSMPSELVDWRKGEGKERIEVDKSPSTDDKSPSTDDKPSSTDDKFSSTDDKDSDSSTLEEKVEGDKEIRDLLDKMEEDMKQVKDEMEKEEEQEKLIQQREERIREHMAKGIQYTSVHRGVRVENCYHFSPTGHLFNQDQEESKEVTRNLTKKLKDAILYNEDQKMSGLTKGYLNQNQLWRNDGKVFYQRKEKSDESDLVFCVLVDESASMRWGGGRDVYARKASIMFAEVCQSLKIPLAVIGHHASFRQRRVQHCHYISFERSIASQKMNLEEIRAKEDNRDGLSIQYCGEYLLKQSQKDKVLIVISDGEPCHGVDDYAYEKGLGDTTLSVSNLEKKGITVVGVAIGDGQDKIAEIYKNFISVTDLGQLPQKLIKILEKKLFKR